MIDEIYAIVEEVRRESAPDPRTAVFEVETAIEDGGLVVFGASSVSAAVERLHLRLAALDPARRIRDEVTRLPAAMGGRSPHALVKVSTAPMLAGPIISGSYLSTILLGHRVMVLREYGRWWQCRAQDGYVGWIHRGYLRRVSEAEARSWDLGGVAAMHLSLGGEVVNEAGELLVRLPWGARVGVRDGIVHLPDGRRGLLRGEAVALAEMSRHFPLEGGQVVKTARRWAGTPYLWGGTTPWGADCSGMVQAVFRAHGLELPRDSDQQALVGVPVEVGVDFADTLPGELLFFAESEGRISHVAISTGGPRVIHLAVGNGGFSANDLTGDNGYERDLRSRFAAARRLINPEA